MKPICVEVNRVESGTGFIISSTEKYFDKIDDFMSYYNQSKDEVGVLLNVRFYDPRRDPKAYSYENMMYLPIKEKDA